VITEWISRELGGDDYYSDDYYSDGYYYSKGSKARKRGYGHGHGRRGSKARKGGYYSDDYYNGGCDRGYGCGYQSKGSKTKKGGYYFELRVQSKTPFNELKTLALQPLSLCDRTFRVLWAKKEKSPQSYVFFAEKDKGIKLEDVTEIEIVKNWMIQSNKNPELSVGKFFKRAKLSFSKTVPAGVLPENCLKI